MAAADDDFAAQAGVAPEIIRRLRREILKEGDHWVKHPTGKVEFLEHGRALLRHHLALEPTPPEKKEGPPPPVLTAIVVQCTPNPTWIKVKLPDNSIHAVRVRNNRRVEPGKRITVAWDEETKTLKSLQAGL